MTPILLISRLFLALVFATAGVAKAMDLAGSRKTLLAFGVPLSLTALIARILPIAELATALALVPAGSAWWGAWAALMLLALFTAAIAVNLTRGRKPECHCFGQLHSEPVGASTLIRNAFLGSLAAFVISRGPNDVGGSPLMWLSRLDGVQLLVLGVGLFVVALVAAGLWLSFHLLQQHGRLLLRIERLEAKRGESASEPEPAGLPLGSKAPSFSLAALDGRTLNLENAEEAGKWLLLLFIEPDCHACEAILPDAAQWPDKGDPLSVVVVSRGSAEENRRKIGSLRIPNVLLQLDREVADAYQVMGTPSAVLVTHGTIASPLAAGGDAIRRLIEHTTAPPPARKGDRVPAIRLEDLEGAALDLATIDKRMLLLFWNPSCGYCQKMLEELKDWEKNPPIGAPQLLVISSGSPEASRAQGFRARVLLDPDSKSADLFGAAGTPSATVIDLGHVASEVQIGAPGVLELAGAVPVHSA